MNKEEEKRLRQEWETPDDFFGAVNRDFNFQIDVCATHVNAKCETYIGKPGEIRADWYDALNDDTPWLRPDEGILRAWCNPGFKDPFPWMQKAYEETQRCPDGVVCVMGIPSFPANWWMTFAQVASEIRLIGGKRINFKPPPGIDSSSNTRTNCLFVFRSNPHKMPPRIWTWDWTKNYEETQ